jgi:hypothetical protein
LDDFRNWIMTEECQELAQMAACAGRPGVLYRSDWLPENPETPDFSLAA